MGSSQEIPLRTRLRTVSTFGDGLARNRSHCSTYEPTSTNISSSVLTPKPTVHASHDPSPAPSAESHDRSRDSAVVPSHASRARPAVQFVGTQGPVLAGTREAR